MLMLKAEGKKNNFNNNFNREARDRNKDFGNNIKGKEGESLIKSNSGEVKITKKGELEVGRNAGSAGKRSISGRSVRASRKTRSSRALWSEPN